MIQNKNIKVNEELFNFVNKNILKNIKIDENSFWNGFSDIVDTFNPRNIELLEKRKNLQNKIDEWHKKNISKNIDIEQYKSFLKEINYIVEEGPDFTITTSNTQNGLAHYKRSIQKTTTC